MTTHTPKLSVPDLSDFIYARKPSHTERAKILIENAYMVSWAHGKRQEYLHTLKHRKPAPYTISNQNLLKIFEIYYGAVTAETKIPLRTFTEATGIHPAGIIRVLERVNLTPPKLWSKKASNKSNLNLVQLMELVNLGFQHYDIDHFTNVENSARHRMNKNGLKAVTCQVIVQAGVSLSSSSKMYKHWDEGNNEDCIQSKFHFGTKKIEYVLDKRKEIAPLIIEGLKIIKPNHIITTPYWT